MKERIFTFLVVDHVARVHVQELVMQEEGPHVRRRHLEFLMTFGDVSSSVASCAPSSDVTTGERSVIASVGAERVGAVRFDSALMWNSGFAEVSTDLASFVVSFCQNVKWFEKSWPVLLCSFAMDWHVHPVCGLEFCHVEWREIVLAVRDVVRIGDLLLVFLPEFAEDGVPHVP